jgi:hypothetical protein
MIGLKFVQVMYDLALAIVFESAKPNGTKCKINPSRFKSQQACTASTKNNGRR